MADNNSSGNAVAIVAIIAIILLVGLGLYFFLVKTETTPTSPKIEINKPEVEAPNVEMPDVEKAAPPQSGEGS